MQFIFKLKHCSLLLIFLIGIGPQKLEAGGSKYFRFVGGLCTVTAAAVSVNSYKYRSQQRESNNREVQRKKFPTGKRLFPQKPPGGVPWFAKC